MPSSSYFFFRLRSGCPLEAVTHPIPAVTAGLLQRLLRTRAALRFTVWGLAVLCERWKDVVVRRGFLKRQRRVRAFLGLALLVTV